MYRAPSLLLRGPSASLLTKTLNCEISAKHLTRNSDFHPALGSSIQIQISGFHGSTVSLQDKRPGIPTTQWLVLLSKSLELLIGLESSWFLLLSVNKKGFHIASPSMITFGLFRWAQACSIKLAFDLVSLCLIRVKIKLLAWYKANMQPNFTRVDFLLL